MKLGEILEGKAYGGVNLKTVDDDLSDEQKLNILKKSPQFFNYIKRPSEQLLLKFLKGRPEWVVDLYHRGDTIPKSVLMLTLSSNKFILNRLKYQFDPIPVFPYDEFVKEYFKNNEVLMRKWLRYAQNVRDLGIVRDTK